MSRASPPSPGFVAVMLVVVLLLALMYVGIARGADAQPGAKFSAPGAVVVQTCGLINSVILTREDGSLQAFDYEGMSVESLRLYLNRVSQVIIVNAPCSK